MSDGITEEMCFECGRPLGSDANGGLCYQRQVDIAFPNDVEECHAVISDLRAKLSAAREEVERLRDKLTEAEDELAAALREELAENNKLRAELAAARAEVKRRSHE